YVSGQRSLLRWMPILAALAAMGIGSGGSMSYGILHGYAQADTPINFAYGFTTLFLQGATWGTFGGALIGLMLEKTPMTTSEWLGLVGTVLFSGWSVSFLVVDVLGFHINPPRNDGSIAYMGAAIGQLIWLATNKKPVGLRGALFAFVGFGVGMSAGRLLGNLANVLQDSSGYAINHWNVMETSCGLIAGFSFAFGMLGRRYPEPPEEKNLKLASSYAIVYVLGLIPLWHRLGRIRPDVKLKEWSASLRTYGYPDPDGLARTVLWLVDGVCVLGFVGALAWLVIYSRKSRGWAALPVLWLSGTMLLFQNLTALYFFYPSRPKYVNMHHVFWVLFVFMLAYAFANRRRLLTSTLTESEIVPEPVEPGVERNLGLIGSLAGGLGILMLVIYLAGFVNGGKTMTSANTRWPIWAWTQGPFPRQSSTR
ncbi:hypothetical protein ACYOEI_27155, partial [Singulisphaera rosea]